MADPQKKAAGEELRVTREGMRKARAEETAESPAEEGWPPAWCVTFSDMMTLLMCFFVLWYALTAMKLPPELLAIKDFETLFPKVDRIRKTLALLESLEVGKEEMAEEKKFELTPEKEQLITDIAEFQKTVATFERYLEEEGLMDLVDIIIAPDEIVISPRDTVLFQKGSATLRPEILSLLDAIILILNKSSGQVCVEGHTDDVPIGAFYRHKYHSNWELSSARAVSVVEYLIKNGIKPSRITASGYGPTKPVLPNISEENRAKNRRVEFHILVTKEERI